MKTRFTTIDLMAALSEIQDLVGLRVNNVYDIDNKTYLLRMMKPEAKAMILIESGLRFHTTEFDYPKNISPSGFSMKLRKHIKQKRLEYARQLGVDRIIDMQFGSGEVACHVIVELYDRGNIILTDNEFLILNVLRPRTDKDTDVRFAVREKYPLQLARQPEPMLTYEELTTFLEHSKSGENLRKILNPKFIFGPALIDHCLLKFGFSNNAQLYKTVKLPDDVDKIHKALQLAEEMFESFRSSKCHGFVILKKETKVDGAIVESYVEFQPFLFAQHDRPSFFVEFPTFNGAVDEFFSKIEYQKIDAKGMQQEKAAVKKLENIRKDHDQRLKALNEAQSVDKRKAELIELNKDLVDKVIMQINGAIASQLNWNEIQDLVNEAKDRGDPVASIIKTLKLDINHVVLQLDDPFDTFNDDYSDDEDDDADKQKRKTASEKAKECALIDIDLNIGAFQNARKYYDHKKQSAVKERKTIEASEKALKSAEIKTQEVLKQVQLKTNISKSRKTYWFEKFIWFISSDNYLVIGGRDAQQNELIVKRYLKLGDAYVHADIRGAASVVVKNRNATDPLPPKTLSEAGTMAICYSAAWDAKIVTSAWWVSSEQVSKTAPSGEYLTTGSFMIRGKKNFLPPCQLIMGFGVLFKLDEECIARHSEARKAAKDSVFSTSTNVDESANAETPDDEILIEDSEESSVEEGEGNSGALLKENFDNDKSQEFPDVTVQLKHLNVDRSLGDNEEISIVQIGPVRPVRQQLRHKETVEENSVKSQTNDIGTKNVPKRRQHGKQKKIKEKYKDQDEEERELRLKLLGSAAVVRPREADSKNTKKTGNKKPYDSSSRTQTKSVNQPKVPPERNSGVSKEEVGVSDVISVSGNVVDEKEPMEKETPKDMDIDMGDDDQDDAKKMADEALSALDALTATPFEDDILIFAVPVCAPYTAVNNYKFKVKLTPGTGKKGKATKTAIQVFLKDKTLTAREKDLVKVLMEQDLARNVPGKVKVSAPQLLAAKRKR